MALAFLVLLYGGFILASELIVDGIGSVHWLGLAGSMAILTLLVFRIAPRSVVVVTDTDLTIAVGTADAITLPFGEIADMGARRGWILIRTAWDLRIAFRPPRLVQEDVLDVLTDRLARVSETHRNELREEGPRISRRTTPRRSPRRPPPPTATLRPMLQGNEVADAPTAVWPWVILVAVPVLGFALILWLVIPRRSAGEGPDA